MRFEFGPTITRWPLTKAEPLPSCLVKMCRFSGTTWPGRVTPAKPARWPGSGGRRYAPVAPIEGLDCNGEVLRSDPTRQRVHCPANRRLKEWSGRRLTELDAERA